jgi:Uncharacterised nucleotidyltransferase/Transglutaminase-like superfamily
MTVGSLPPPTSNERLANLILYPEQAQAADLPLLESAGLAGWIAARLPPAHTLQAALQPQRLGLLARHLQTRRVLLPLLQVWAQAGHEVLVFKGFAHAQFEASSPAARPYGDVDLWLHPERCSPAEVARLVELAWALGWRSDGAHQAPELWNNEVAHLYAPDGSVRLDLHRSPVVSRGRGGHRLRRRLELIWQASVPVTLDDVPLRLLSPTDRALVGLILNRWWGGDSGRHKASDYPDLQTLAARHGLTRPALLARAAQLQACNTARSFLASCDPWRGVLSLGSDTSRAMVAALRDGHTEHLGMTAVRVARWPRLLLRMLWVLPDLLWVLRLLRQTRDPRQLVAQLAGHRAVGHRAVMHGASPPSAAQLGLLLSAVRHLTRLLRRDGGDCLPRALTTARVLARRGLPVRVISGVRRTPAGLESHAWVEGPAWLLEIYGEPFNRSLFAVLLDLPVDPC